MAMMRFKHFNIDTVTEKRVQRDQANQTQHSHPTLKLGAYTTGIVSLATLDHSLLLRRKPRLYQSHKEQYGIRTKTSVEAWPRIGCEINHHRLPIGKGI
jgi:hypothetical protein